MALLTTPLALASLLVAICLLVYHYLVLPIFLSPLSKIPAAHPLCSFSERWLRWQQDHQNEAKSLYAAHQQHGPIARIGPQEVSLNSLEGLRGIYTAGLEKTSFYNTKFENYGTVNLVSTLDHRAHSTHKRMITSVHAKSYVQHSPDVASLSKEIVIQRWLPLLQQYAGAKQDVNVMDLFQWAGIDFMSAYNFGTARGTDFLRDKAGREVYFGEWTKFRDQGFAGAKINVESLGMRMLKDALKDEPPADGTNAVVASLFHAQLLQKAKGEESSMSNEELMRRCASEMLDHMVAAHETFAITLTYVIYQLSLDPALQASLRSELLTLGPSILPDKTDLPSPDQIDRLPLFNSILLETLRLYAPAPGRLPRAAPPGGMTLHDCYIPAGTTVSCNAYSLHRKEDVFPRPFEWLPQRWMTEKERSGLGLEFPPPGAIRRYMWAFGSEGRMCIGSNWAMQILKLLVASIYTGFTTSIVDDEGIEQSDTLIAGPKSGKLIIQFHEVSA